MVLLEVNLQVWRVPDLGVYGCMAVKYARGRMSLGEREREVGEMRERSKHHFLTWCDYALLTNLSSLNSRIAVYFLDPAREQYDH